MVINMEVYSEVFGGRFKYIWHVLFYMMLNRSMIITLVTALGADSSGYIVYCPCMGKLRLRTDKLLVLLAYLEVMM